MPGSAAMEGTYRGQGQDGGRWEETCRHAHEDEQVIDAAVFLAPRSGKWRIDLGLGTGL